ncbi:MAG: glycosyltransferase family 4 protein [Patescibacteria group bacterium]
MIIGIDARFYGTGAKGLGRYTQKLITHLEDIDHENDYVIFLRRENWDEYRPQNPRFRKVLADFRWYTLREQIFFPLVVRRERVDVMHFTHFNVPLWYVGKFIVTIHDLILTKYPTQRASTLGPLLYRIKHAAYLLTIRRAIRRASRIIAVSQYTKADIVAHFGVAPEKISVTYEAVDVPVQEEPNDQSVLDRYHVVQPYLLHVGNVYPHKNIERLLEALAQVRQSHPQLSLVLVGKEDYFINRMKKLVQSRGLAGAVIFTGYVPDGSLPSLYRHASAYVFPSLCEGFGLPGLEACAFGVPVAASNNSCLPEILGSAAVYFDPHDGAAMAVAIRQLIENRSVADRLIALGHEQVRAFSWKVMAERTRALYSQ